MNVLVVGMSHRGTPVDILERATVTGPDLPKLLDVLQRTEHVSEALLLSTCNRVEVYAVVETFHGGVSDVSGVLGEWAGLDLDRLADHLYVRYAGSAVEHMFTVAAGLDSMVVGEPQILGQLRSAYTAATEVGTVGRVLHELSQQALRVGKRVHAETTIDAAGASLVSEALVDADAALGGLDGARAVVVGAGSMGALAAAHLRRAGVAELVVANRTFENAARLAETTSSNGTPARAVELAELPAELGAAQLLVTCTGAADPVLTRAEMAEALHGRADRPLVVCDLGLPRNVEPGVGELPAVHMIDLAALQARLRGNDGGGAVPASRVIIAEELHSYLAAQRSAEVTPTVTALRRRAADVVDAELLRLAARLPELDGEVRDELAATVRRVVDKLLHTPTVRIKQLAEGPDGGTYAEALRELFELDPQAPVAVTTPVAAVDGRSSGGEVR